MAVKENIKKAADDVGFLISDLHEANKDSSPLEHIVLIDLIEVTARLQIKIQSLLNAIGGGK